MSKLVTRQEYLLAVETIKNAMQNNQVINTGWEAKEIDKHPNSVVISKLTEEQARAEGTRIREYNFLELKDVMDEELERLSKEKSELQRKMDALHARYLELSLQKERL